VGWIEKKIGDRQPEEDGQSARPPIRSVHAYTHTYIHTYIHTYSCLTLCSRVLETKVLLVKNILYIRRILNPVYPVHNISLLVSSHLSQMNLIFDKSDVCRTVHRNIFL